MGIYDDQYGLCLPKIFVTYKREYLKVNDVRITIDENISYKTFKTGFIKKDNDIIIELKTSFFKNLDDLIKEFPFQKLDFQSIVMVLKQLIKLINFYYYIFFFLETMNKNWIRRNGSTRVKFDLTRIKFSHYY